MGALDRLASRVRVPSVLQGPRLQVANLVVFYLVVYATVDFPNPIEKITAAVALAAVLDVGARRLHFGDWQVPWGSVIGTLGAWLVLDGFGWLPYLLLPVIVVASRHLIRWRGGHLFNANNLAMCALLVVGLGRIGVNDWGAAPQTVALMVLFGTVATRRVNRFDLALIYLGLSFAVYAGIALWMGWGLATAWIWALSPLQVMIGFFAVTDPATSPGGDRLAKVVFALLIVLLGVPATLAGYVEAPLFALLLAAPQRHLVEDGLETLRTLVRETGPEPEPAGGPTGGGGR